MAVNIWGIRQSHLLTDGLTEEGSPADRDGSERRWACSATIRRGAWFADEARLVIGPWLAALETRRPFVTWVHVVSEHGIPSETTALLSELRHQFDAVLNLAGYVEEGVSDAHGIGMIELAEVRPPYDPAQTLEALHEGGVRTLLLLGILPLAEPFLSSHVIDQIEIRSTPPISLAAVPPTAAWSCLPPGYRLTSIARTANGVRVQAIRAATTIG